MFDYNCIRIQNKWYQINEILNDYHNNDIITYLDKDPKWTESLCNLLIESILLGIDIGSFYGIDLIDPFPDKKVALKILDGYERLGCINAFYLNMFQLSELEILTELTGLYFKDLPIILQRKFTSHNLMVKSLTMTPNNIIDSIISRINT